MSAHLTKRTPNSPSQTFPSTPPKPVPDVTLADTYVVLCDWHGQVVWKSGAGDRVQIGEPIWLRIVGPSRECLKSAVASVATLREQQSLEVEGERGQHFRLWMWPLNEPDIAICVLAKSIPSELALLTEREKACLSCLAKGMSTREIVDELEIGMTTVHTHLRRSREKLGLPSAEALIGFAARYFSVTTPANGKDSLANRKQSG